MDHTEAADAGEGRRIEGGGRVQAAAGHAQLAAAAAKLRRNILTVFDIFENNIRKPICNNENISF